MKKLFLFQKAVLLFACLWLSHSVHAQITTFPWAEGFENNGNMPTGWTQQQISGTVNWTFIASTTGTPNTSHSGSYKACFASLKRNVTNKLITPRLDISNLSNPTITFWHTQEIWSGEQDTLRIYYRTSATGEWTLLRTYSNNMTTWTEETILLPNKSNDYYIAFEGIAYYGHGIQLDDISVFDVYNNDAATTNVSWNLSAGLTAARVKATLKNIGINNINSLVIKYQLNNNTPISVTFPENLTSLSDVDLTFMKSEDISTLNSYVLKVWTELVGDENPANDTITLTLAPPTSIYNTADKEALRNFLRQPAPANYTEATSGNYTSWNGGKLGLNITDTTHWKTHETWVPEVEALSWDNSTPKRLTQISWGGKSIAGDLKTSDSLIYLYCASNYLTNLEVTQSTQLSTLECSYNKFTNLDLKQNTKLAIFKCSRNYITNLDITKNTELTNLNCSYNQLTNLDLTQNTKLINLDCSNNKITNLNLAQNTQLTDLYCTSNQIFNLNVTQSTKLINLYCNNNQLAHLNLAQNTQLITLDCSSNKLPNLDITQNTNLNYLRCYSNLLNSINFAQNSKLNHLDCYNNQLPSLNLAQNTQLAYLNCLNNQLSNLNLTQNTQLAYLNCANNLLTQLDITQNKQLTNLRCGENHLPLAALNTLWQRTDIASKTFGTQILATENVLTNTAVGVDTVFNGTGTTFTVIKYNGATATLNTDYSVANGNITFLTPDIYRVETNNSTINTANVFSSYAAGINLPTAKKTVPFTEDFETGGNNWVIANGNKINQWIVGTGTAQSGTKAIYISNDMATNTYYGHQACVVHFYADVEFTTPSTAGYQLTFDRKGMGIGKKDIYYSDYLAVAITDTANLPFAEHEFGTPNLGIYINDSTWQHTVLNFPASYYGTVKRLVFTWRNDNGGGIQPPAAIDNISIKTLELDVTGIALDQYAITLNIAATQTLAANTIPYNANNKTITWISRNPAIATIDNNGVVTGIAQGVTYMVATTQDGNFTDSCRVTVVQKVTGITLDKHAISLKVNETQTLAATIAPNNATNKSVIWLSRNSTIAIVSNNGVVTGIAEGVTYIIATTQDGNFTDSCQVTVTPKTGIEDITTQINTFTVYPNPVTNGKLKIESGEWQNSTSLKGEAISIYTITGTLVGTYTLTGKITEIDIANLPKGSYLLKVGNQTVKVIKN